MTKEQYFLMCEQLGTEPLDEEVPLEYQDFPEEIQEALQIFHILPDIWEGFGGNYLGKDYTLLPYLMQVFNVKEIKDCILYIHRFNIEMHDIYSKKAEQRRQVSESKKKKNPNDISISG
jgi:hypothetical protein